MTQALGSAVAVAGCVLLGMFTGIGLVGPGGVSAEMGLFDILLAQLVSVIGAMIGVSLYHNNR